MPEIKIEIEFDEDKEFEMLTYEERLELIPALVDVARAYYEEPDKLNLAAGICYNVMEVGKVKTAYIKIGCLMKELGFEGDYFEGDAPTDTKDNYEAWEKRAYMCLVLSEYLWNTLDDSLEVNLDEEPTKSIFQKVKDKVNAIQENLRVYFEARGGLMSKLDKSERVSV